MHKTYRDFYLARAQSAIAAAKAATDIPHPGLKGEIREILVRDLFRPLLPLDVGVGTGQIVSAFGETSSQQDIVLYDRRILPPILFEERTGLFPIESVLYVIEIKTLLNSTELHRANKAAEQLLKIQFYSGQYDDDDKPLSHNMSRPAYCVFAFGSDLCDGGKTEIERYIELCAADSTLTRIDGPPVRILCVVGRGCWIWRNSAWVPWAEKYPLAEVLRFISVVMNGYRKKALDRGAPRLGAYLLDQ